MLFVGSVLLLALAIGGVRLVISNIEYFQSEIGYLLQRDVHQGIVFNRVSGKMNRFNPVVRIDNVSINLPDRSQPLFIDRLEIEFDFWSSIRERAPVALEVSGKLEKIELTRVTDGRWRLNEFDLGATAGDTSLPGFSELLAILPRYLKLDLRRLIVRDQKHETTHLLERVSARIIHRDDRFFTEASAALPDALGRGVLLKTVVTEDSSLIYLNTTDLRLNPLAQLFDIDTRGLKSGALDGEVWLQMSGYQVNAVHGDLNLKRGVFQVAADKSPLEFDYHGLFTLAIEQPGWRISNRVKRLAIDGRRIPGFEAQAHIPGGASGDSLSAWIDRLPISSLPVVAGQWLPNTLNAQIGKGELQGLLQNLRFEMDFGHPELFRFATIVQDLSSRQFGRFPGVTNLNADLVMGNNRLTASVYGESMQLDFGDQFRAPLEFDSLRMQAVMNRLDSGDFVLEIDDIQASNADVSSVGRLLLETNGEQAPFMYLRAEFSDAMAGATQKYIPVKLMPPNTIEWLDRSIVGGFVPEGNLQFHGRLRDIRELARTRAGEFFVDFYVEGGHIQFAPDWLPAKDAYGRVLFHNAGVEFDIDQGSYDSLGRIQVRGNIGNFEQAALQLAITTEATTADAVRVWGNTPVGARFRDLLARLQDMDGRVRAAVDLRLPLGRDVLGREVSVAVDFVDAAANVPDWGVELTGINGQLRVGEDSVDSSNLSARFFGDPVRIDVASENTGLATTVAVQGKLESANLLRRLPSYLAENVSGKSDWRVQLTIAGDAAPEQTPVLRINANSNLQQTRIDLPEPFRKPADVETPFNTDVEFATGLIRFQSRWDDKYRGRGLLREDADGYQLAGLDVAFAEGLRAKPIQGINLYGFIEELSVDEWAAVFESAGETGAGLLESVELEIDSVLAFGHSLTEAKFEMKRVDQRFLGLIDASLVKGSFELPLQATIDNPVLLNLDYLLIDEVEQEPDTGRFRPADVPPLRLTSKIIRFHDMLFSDLSIAAHPAPDELEVTRFELRRDALFLSGKAQWRYTPGDGHLSSMNLTIRGLGLGEAMAGLGFGNSISKGTIDFSGGFTWPAPLLGFNLENLVGDARLRIEDGVLNNVEPGTGRFVGLFSLSALPRRLSLDFSDIIIGGMEFDEITGNYHIENGDLITTSTRMEGPAAKIKVSGKTGIIRRDYDQVISVIPNIRQTLPLLGAVSAGTTVGWGLLLLQNLFKEAIDDAVEVEYHVTGGWDDPQVELIKAVDENQQKLPKKDK